MNTTITHSDPPRTDQRRTGGTLSGQIVGNKLTDVVLLGTLLDMLAEGFFGSLIASLSEAGLEEVFKPVVGNESSASLHFMLHPDGKDIILDLKVTSWVYELPEREFHALLFEKMKPVFLKIFEEFTFNDITSDPEGWFRQTRLAAILLHRNRS